MNHQLHISPATIDDLPALAAVHRSAFATDLEARLMRLIVNRGQASVSLKAVVGGTIVGHVLFSPATCEPSAATEGTPRSAEAVILSRGLGLGPVAVVPAHKREGIGTALVWEGIAVCQSLNSAWIVVLGEPGFYGRFGFVPASRHAISGEFGGGDAFGLLVLPGHAPPTPGGHIRYAAEFRELCGG